MTADNKKFRDSYQCDDSCRKVRYSYQCVVLKADEWKVRYIYQCVVMVAGNICYVEDS